MECDDSRVLKVSLRFDHHRGIDLHNTATGWQYCSATLLAWRSECGQCQGLMAQVLDGITKQRTGEQMSITPKTTIQTLVETDLATRFPGHFLWGAATASYQIEGAVHED